VQLELNTQLTPGASTVTTLSGTPGVGSCATAAVDRKTIAAATNGRRLKKSPMSFPSGRLSNGGLLS
jgi:hypothetical protein